MAEARIEREGFGRDLCHRVDRRRRRQQQHIGPVPQGLGLAPQHRQPVARLECVGGGIVLAAGDDPAGHREQRFGLPGDQILDRDQTLGDPRAVIEQGTGRAKRPEIGLDAQAADGFERRRGGGEEVRTLAVAIEFESGGRRRGEPKRRLDDLRFGGKPSRKRIGGVVAGANFENSSGVLAAQGKDRDAIDRAASGHHAAHAEAAAGGLQPDDVVECGRHAPRTGGVGTEREADQARGHRDRRAGARTARNKARIERVARHPVGRTAADQPGRKLVHIGLADEDRAGLLQPGDDRRRDRRPISKGRAGRRRLEPGGIDIVLDRKRDAEERQPCQEVGLAPGAPVERRCPRQERRLRHPRDPHLVVAGRGDARDHLRDQRRGGEPARNKSLPQTRQVEAL